MANQLQPTNGVIKKGGEYLKDSDKLTQEICLARETININGIKNFSLKTIFRLASQVYPNWDNEYCQRLIKKFTLNIKQKYIKLSKGM